MTQHDDNYSPLTDTKGSVLFEHKILGRHVGGC